MRPRLPIVLLLAAVRPSPRPACASAAHPAGPAGAGPDSALRMPPEGYGSLTQTDLALRIATPEIEVRMVPLDQRVTRLLARDTYESLRALVESRARLDRLGRPDARHQPPGLALVTFFGQQAGIRFDPQTLTVTFRNRISGRSASFPSAPGSHSQQLNVREQVSGIYLFEEELPVNDSFTLQLRRRQTSDDWQNKQRELDRERARVSARARANGSRLQPRRPSTSVSAF